jgi:hypothetical protein
MIFLDHKEEVFCVGDKTLADLASFVSKSNLDAVKVFLIKIVYDHYVVIKTTENQIWPTCAKCRNGRKLITHVPSIFFSGRHKTKYGLLHYNFIYYKFIVMHA